MISRGFEGNLSQDICLLRVFLAQQIEVEAFSDLLKVTLSSSTCLARTKVWFLDQVRIWLLLTSATAWSPKNGRPRVRLLLNAGRFLSWTLSRVVGSGGLSPLL